METIDSLGSNNYYKYDNHLECDTSLLVMLIKIAHCIYSVCMDLFKLFHMTSIMSFNQLFVFNLLFKSSRIYCEYILTSSSVTTKGLASSSRIKSANSNSWPVLRKFARHKDFVTGWHCCLDFNFRCRAERGTEKSFVAFFRDQLLLNFVTVSDFGRDHARAL